MDYEARIVALGLDFDTVAAKLEEIADRCGVTVDVVLSILERHKQLKEQRDAPELPSLDEMADSAFALRSVTLHNPTHDLKMPWTPPKRRSSKRAQRARERPWSRS